MLFIDSNIWCYYFNRSAPEHAKVSAYLDKILSKESIVLNTTVVMEIAHFLIKNLGAVEGREKVRQLLAFPLQVDDFDYELLLESIDELAQYTHTGIDGRDATILSTMRMREIKKLVTHDKSFEQVSTITVIDPLE